MVETKIHRSVANIVPISNLYLGKYIDGNENNTSYLELVNKKKINRVNIVGTVVMQKNLGSITALKIDDGSDVINLKFFEFNKGLDQIEIGNVILVIGKIREYNAERYIAAEIIKKVSARWLKYRSFMLKLSHLQELEIDKDLTTNIEDNGGSEFESIDNVDKKVNKYHEKENNDNPYLKLMSLITKLDSGSGVALEKVINESGVDNTEELLQKMMESGDIFQNVPGKFKVL